MLKLDAEIESLVGDLPDAEGARLFYERATSEHPRVKKQFERDRGLLSDALALAAWSPLLGTTLAQNPDYLTWLARERTQTRVRTAEEFGESLARFALTHSQVGAQIMLARFRRRELLRTYLHDIRRVSTLVETTEELSNLADAVLQYALSLAQQELENLYGLPQCTDARGRTSRASFCVVALGKLGSRELNYSSDIDLMFLYSDDGETSGQGERGTLTNREYFAKLAERIARIVGQQAGEGAAYRVDLRLRPHGRVGALATSLDGALLYYREKAQAWELQALIRARASAGSQALYARFAEALRERVYRPDETVARALSHVRLAKQKIDRQHGERAGGFNVKLGRGGIREIEFIAQALQLAYGGHDAWLHAPHTLISLGRLADRALVTERERSALSDAYAFLRTLEHRVQMENGLQTHLVPEDDERRALVARRMHFTEPGALDEFDRALKAHTNNVHATYARVFAVAENSPDEQGEDIESVGERFAETERAGSKTKRADSKRSGDFSGPEQNASQSEQHASHSGRQDDAPNAGEDEHGGSRASGVMSPAPARVVQEAHVDAESAAAMSAASVFAPRLAGLSVGLSVGGGDSPTDTESLARALRSAAAASLNARRALLYVARVAASLDKSGASVELSETSLDALVKLCGASEFFGEIIAANPLLIPALTTESRVVVERDYRALLRASVNTAKNFGGDLSALRRAWSHMIVEIGACDVAGTISPIESNRLQANLAAASINVAALIARRELARRHGRLASGPRLAALALGRLASGGTDYGSDLDLVLVYDARAASPLEGFTHEEAYARFAELLVAALSSLTRDGYLYRVDLRLRPDGRNGTLALGSRAFVNYVTERAGVWEWLAYVKLRAVAGDLELGRSVEREARAAIHEAARRIEPETLRVETRRVRERLERERAGSAHASRSIDIKFGPGGMLDVYFAARYLQLRDSVPDDGEDRSTRATLLRLREMESIGDEEFAALDEGYTLLRALDHQLRLLVGRSTRLPSAEDHPVLGDLARRAGYASTAALAAELRARMSRVRAAYERITEGEAGT
ncbi:MAG TPA: hypothetical protein VM934_14345 [Pyrinomonadaceae bacterium]|nr:hypothetical protein [Pyrinomonadaceae bacterium]